MKLDEFLKKDALNFLESFDSQTAAKSKAAVDETAFLLAKANNGEAKPEAQEQFIVQPADENVTIDLDLFPSESSGSTYEETSPVTTPTIDAPKEVQEQVLHKQQNVSVAPVQQAARAPSQQSMDRTQIKLLVEQELETRMQELRASMPTQKTVMESPNRADILRLKNEIIDLKTIVGELQNKKAFAKEEHVILKGELKRAESEAELARREAKLAQEKIISLKNKKAEIISLIKFKEKPVERKMPAPREFVPAIETKVIQPKPLPKPSTSKEIISDIPAKPVMLPKPEPKLESKTIPKLIPELKKEKVIVSTRSQELPEVLLIEEQIHHLKESLSQKDYDKAKGLYEDVRSRAIKLKEHDDEKKVIYEQLQNAAKILSLALKGQISSTSKSKDQFIDVSDKPAVLMKKHENKEMSSDSMEKYVDALEAMKKKEKAKSLKLLISLADLYPTHLGIKLRLQQALAL